MAPVHSKVRNIVVFLLIVEIGDFAGLLFKRDDHWIILEHIRIVSLDPTIAMDHRYYQLGLFRRYSIGVVTRLFQRISYPHSSLHEQRQNGLFNPYKTQVQDRRNFTLLQVYSADPLIIA